MEWVIPLISLAAMEIVLGIDNVIFIAIWWRSCLRVNKSSLANWG